MSNVDRQRYLVDILEHVVQGALVDDRRGDEPSLDNRCTTRSIGSRRLRMRRVAVILQSVLGLVALATHVRDALVTLSRHALTLGSR
jgi:hypothetical protein